MDQCCLFGSVTTVCMSMSMGYVAYTELQRNKETEGMILQSVESDFISNDLT